MSAQEEVILSFQNRGEAVYELRPGATQHQIVPISVGQGQEVSA
jgi:hypothetical protein